MYALSSETSHQTRIVPCNRVGRESGVDEMAGLMGLALGGSDGLGACMVDTRIDTPFWRLGCH